MTPPDLQVRAVATVDGPGVVFTANPIDDATSIHVWRYRTTASLRRSPTSPACTPSPPAAARRCVRTATLDEPGAQWATLDGVELATVAATPSIRADVHLSFAGDRRIATAVLLPRDHDGAPLARPARPLRRAPRGARRQGAQRPPDVAVVRRPGVRRRRRRRRAARPGRGSEWERAVHHDLATRVLDDQIAALHHAADEHGVLDLERVAIRGWSFGGYLAALAVLRRPDVFHAAIAGAPVTEWRLYDTHYTERYLGDPGERPDVYDANSLLPLADGLTRPLLLIHGLADDNVVAAHTLQLSSALLAAGRPHEVLPLVGITHMTPQEVVAENLLLHQLDFLRRSLRLSPE